MLTDESECKSLKITDPVVLKSLLNKKNASASGTQM